MMLRESVECGIFFRKWVPRRNEFEGRLGSKAHKASEQQAEEEW